MAKSSFCRHLERRLAVTEGHPIELSGAQRDALWTGAGDAARYGITSLGGCLALCHIYFELGLDCVQRYKVFQAVLTDPRATESEKVEALWVLRSRLFAILRGA